MTDPSGLAAAIIEALDGVALDRLAGRFVVTLAGADDGVMMRNGIRLNADTLGAAVRSAERMVRGS
jgi:hypothetical protein